jgi:hypothetical protein
MNESLRQAELANREVEAHTEEAIAHLQGDHTKQNAYGILSIPTNGSPICGRPRMRLRLPS